MLPSQRHSHGQSTSETSNCSVLLSVNDKELSSYLLEVPNDSYPTLVDSDWLFNTQSRVLQADWFKLEINERATLNINMPY